MGWVSFMSCQVVVLLCIHVTPIQIDPLTLMIYSETDRPASQPVKRQEKPKLLPLLQSVSSLVFGKNVQSSVLNFGELGCSCDEKSEVRNDVVILWRVLRLAFVRLAAFS